MSYILDALKKAERKRPPGPVPDLFTVQGPQPPAERRVRPVVLFLMAGVAVLAAIALWEWRGERGTPVAFQPVPAAAPKPPPAPVPAETRALQGAPAVAAPVAQRPVAPAAQTTPARPRSGRIPSRPPPPARSVAAPQSAPVSGAPQPVVPATAPPPAVPVAPSTAPPPAVPAEGAPSPAASAPAPPEAPALAAPEAEEEPSALPAAPPAEPAPPPDGRVVTVDELPERVRTLAGKLNLSGHVWSEDAELRMVTVQDRIVREGAEAAPGVRLEQVTPAGAVFSADGWRFSVGGR